LSVAASSLVPEGIVKTVTTEGKGRPINLGDIATVKYTCYLPNDADNNNNNKPFAKATKQKMVRVREKEREKKVAVYCLGDLLKKPPVASLSPYAVCCCPMCPQFLFSNVPYFG
jgi:hypothetical protein